MNSKKNRLFAGLLAVIMLISVFPVTVFATEADLTISTPEQLRQFAADVNGGNTYEGRTVVLTANIVLGGEGSPWTPIGTSANQFKGTFDGGNHVVSGLYISDTSGTHLGLFGYVNGGTVENLTVRGSVTGQGNVAGIVGYLNVGIVRNCGNNANVTGASAVGGVAGYVGGASTVSGCYNSGSITGTTGYIGGVTGQHWRAGTVENCYNAGTVTGPATVGGVAGGHKAASPALTNCYNAGEVVDSAGNSNNIGALVGASKGTNTNCYYIKGVGTDTKAGITEVEVLSASDLGSSFVDGASYPVLSWESAVSTDAPVRPAFVESTERSAQLSKYITAAVTSTRIHSGLNGTLLGSENYTAGASSTATDWMALAMGRFGYYQSGSNYLIDDGSGYEDYLAAMRAYIETTYAENNGILHSTKATEWHRAVVTIAALGGDPTCTGFYNGNPIDLIADGSYNNKLKAGPGTQGINGWIWGLISMDTRMYEVPEDAKYTREDYITEILKLQLTDGVNGNEYGGWVLGGYGSSSDVDITAMAIQSLAPYYNDDTVYTFTNANSKVEVSKTVRQCIDEALDRLGTMMNENAGFTSWNTDNVESISQVVVALCSLGINPASDGRFITSDGKTLLDGMLRFRLSDGGFCHILGGGWNSMANDQATYALVSYWRLENGMRALYDMRDDWTAGERAAIDAAINAIAAIGSPTDSDYKAQLKAALTVFRAVPEDEQRYVDNYSALASAIELVGGEAALDTDESYIAAIAVTKQPDKLVYSEGEAFDTTGMIVTATYNTGTTEEVTDYSLSVGGKLTVGTGEIYIIYGKLRDKIFVTVNEKMPWSGDGSASSPYLIETAGELQELAARVNKGNSFSGYYFLLNNNIDLSGISDWTPIGKSSSCQFDGIFDGQGYVIDNLYSTTGGLFGYVCVNAVIKNVGVASGEIGASNSSFMGGIAKWSNGADFVNCWNGADIYCSGYSGGIVGTVRDGGESIIQGCCNVGSVYASDGAVGGIVGHLATSGNGTSVNVTVSDCYNAGSITADDNAAGIVGRAQDGHLIQNCYNIGEISVTGSNILNGAGAVVSFATSDNEIKNCYYDSTSISCGVSWGTDTTVGQSSDAMKSDEFIALLGDSFKKDAYALVNGGYPILYWQETGDADEITAVIEKIDAIGTVTLESNEKINEARNAYDNLDSELQRYVTNLSSLVQAEKALSDLQSLKQIKETAVAQLETYKSLSDYRPAQQGEIGQIVLDGRTAIEAASDAEAVKAALGKAKAELDAVKTDKQLTDEESAKTVSAMIDAIGTVTLGSEAAIGQALAGYNSLSDEAKALIANYSVLLRAEAILSDLRSAAAASKPSDDKIPSDSSESKYQPESSTAGEQIPSPKTGDKSDIICYAALMIISLLTVVTLTKERKGGRA